MAASVQVSAEAMAPGAPMVPVLCVLHMVLANYAHLTRQPGFGKPALFWLT